MKMSVKKINSNRSQVALESFSNSSQIALVSRKQS